MRSIVTLQPGVYRFACAFADPSINEPALAGALGRLGVNDVVFDAEDHIGRVRVGGPTASMMASARFDAPKAPQSAAAKSFAPAVATHDVGPAASAAARLAASPSAAAASVLQNAPKVAPVGPPPPPPPPPTSMSAAARAIMASPAAMQAAAAAKLPIYSPNPPPGVPPPPPHPAAAITAAKMAAAAQAPGFSASAAAPPAASPAETAAAASSAKIVDAATGYVWDPSSRRWVSPKGDSSWDPDTNTWYGADGKALAGDPNAPPASQATPAADPGGGGGGGGGGGDGGYSPPSYGSPGMGDGGGGGGPPGAPPSGGDYGASNPDAGGPRGCVSVSKDGKVWLCPGPQDSVSGVSASLPYEFRFIGRLARPATLENTAAFQVRSVEPMSIDPFEGARKDAAGRYFPLETGVRYDVRVYSRDKTAATHGDVETLLEAMGWAVGALMLARRNVRIPSKPGTSLSEWIATGTWTGPDTITVEGDPFLFVAVAPSPQQR